MSQALVKLKPASLLTKYFSGKSISYPQMIALFIPLLVDQAFIVGLNLINTAMISSSGVAAVSAVNMVDSLNIFLISVFVAVATGGTVVVAQYKGSDNPNMVSKSTAGTISSVAVLSLGIGVLLSVFHMPALNLLFGSAAPDVFDNARIYLIGSSVSYLGIGIVEAVCGALRGIGRSRASLFLSLIMNLSYVVLNIVFINFMHMGVTGLSVAMNVSRYLAAACAILYLVRVDTNLQLRIMDMIRINWAMFKKIMFIGLPFAAEQMFFNGGKILTQIFIVGLGTNAIATNAICGTLANVVQIPANALSLTVITVVGQCIGSKNIDDARKFTKSFVWLSSLSFVLTGAIVMSLFHPLVSMFHPPQEIVHDIFIIMLINSLIQIPLWSISFIAPSALRAAGDSKYTSIVSMLSMWLFRVVLGYILGVVSPLGILGVWLAMELEWGIRGFIFMRRFAGNKWYQHKLID
ncbi:MATE family efflux transporter [Paenibacillus physcomitrellae]|uniref:Probable multidrug resistance protein NorM n=1 Tax=Paenibacillus physcomitrellae TaxID=1619311 RepID=A0ABQ1GI73_9BACL|nr:MATE family efflux transporter [Paenibacillus physcomitrellae]GGA44183.1 MATE family multidrug exporter [Paenibacillus physcomitrellae]